MGEAGHVGAKFGRTLRGGNRHAAKLLAYELDHVTLADALALTILAAQKHPDDYPKMARRLLARLAAEVKPPLPALSSVAGLMADVDAGRLHPTKLFGPVERVIEGKPIV